MATNTAIYWPPPPINRESGPEKDEVVVAQLYTYITHDGGNYFFIHMTGTMNSDTTKNL